MVGMLGSTLILSACGEEEAQGATDEGSEEPSQEETMNNDENEMDNNDESESNESDGQTVKVGETFTVDGAKITVDNPIWAMSVEAYDEPQYDGYFIIQAKMKNTTDEPIEGLDYTFTLKTPEGEIFQESFASREDTNFSELSSIQANSTIKGQIAFDVPKVDEYTLIIDPKRDDDQVKITIPAEDVAKK